MQSIMKLVAYRGRWCGAIAIAAAAGFLPPSAAQAQSGASDAAAPSIYIANDERAPMAASPDALMALARDRGELPVIVGFDAAFEPEGNLSEAQVAGQRDSIAASQEALLAAVPDAQNVTRYETIPYMAATLGPDDLQRIMSAPGVTSVHEDIPVPPTLEDSVPLVKAPPLWADGIEGTGQSVAVLDTGARPNHAAFRDQFGNSKLVASACYSSTTSDSTTLCRNGQEVMLRGGNGGAAHDCDRSSISGCGHGTHVASTAAGFYQRNDGVARGSNIIPMQVFSRFDSSSFCGSAAPCVLAYTSDQISALERAFRWHKKYDIAAVNMSLGGGGTTTPCDFDSRAAIIENLRSRGVAAAISSGNSGFIDGVGFPACISAAVTVGSSTKTDQVSFFSNHDEMVDLLAPGSSIQAADSEGSRSALRTLSGTSMAAPHVAGAFALLKSAMPGATVDQLERALKCTGVPVTDLNLPRPRIRLAHAYREMMDPLTENRWSFLNDRQVDGWKHVLGDWMRVGRDMQVSATESHEWYLAESRFCADDVVVTAKMTREDPDDSLEWPSGVIIGGYSDDSDLGNFSGLLFSYSVSGGPDGDQTLVEVAEVAGRSGVDDVGGEYDVLCSDDFFGRPLGSPRVLKVVKQGNELTFDIDGDTVCTAVTDSRYNYGKVGVFMRAPATSPDHVLTVDGVAMRALGWLGQ